MYRLVAVLWLTASGLAGPKQTASQTPNPPATAESERGPSLAELARRQREQRGDKPVRLIRNEDLRTLEKARVVTSQVAKTAAQPADTQEGPVVLEGAAEETAEAGVDLKFWEGAFAEARTALETAVNQRMVLELRMNNLRNAFFQQADGTTRQHIEGEMAKTLQEIEQARQNEQAARQAVSDLERQAARAGIPAGKIRELVGELPESKSMFEGVPETGGAGPES
ncbi:MAG: hypothetical protein Kow001_02570 [Acidobacteriota bacterium]